MGAGAENPMKAPLLLLLAVAAVSSPAAAEIAAPPHRCKVDWLQAAQKTPLGQTIADPDKYLSAGPAFDVAKTPAVCDKTVWNYLSQWTDPARKAKWDSGLAGQIDVLLAADAFYQRVDAAGRITMARADEAVDAAVASGVVVKKDGGAPGKDLQDKGRTGAAFAGEKTYSVEAAPAGGADPVAPADMTAAFAKLLVDAPKPKGAKGAKPAPAKAPLAGPAVVAFNKALVVLANEVRAGYPGKTTANFKDADDQAAAAFLTDPAITAAVDGDPRPAAALSGLDYGLRNIIALRAAAVGKSVSAAKTLLNGRSVAETLAAAAKDPRLPENQSAKDMSALVLKRLDEIKDYHDLNKMYDDESKKPDSRWMKENGEAAKAQLEVYRNDAKQVQIVNGPNGRPALQYSVGGTKVVDTGIAVAALDRSSEYRDNIAEAIAQSIGTITLSDKAKVALAVARGGDPAAGSAPNGAEIGLPAKNPVVVTAPGGITYVDLQKATPAQGFLGRIFSPKGNVERYYSKINEAAAEKADAQAQHRIAFEDAANDAADAERSVRAAKRKEIADNSAPYSPDLKEDPKIAVLWAYDAETNAKAAAARKAFMESHKAEYVSKADSDAALAAKRAELNARVDSAYSDGITKALGRLHKDYATYGTSRQKYAAKKSGYDGHDDKGPFYKTDRVDAYFAKSWDPAANPKAVGNCKAALGFKKDGDSGDFKDPSDENVDKICGVRDGLVKELETYKHQK
jgi:hypothetical protein